MRRMNRPSRRYEAPVYVNVYDLSPYNNWLYGFGLGAYHSGLEVHGREYSFGQGPTTASGVFAIAPRSADGAVFRQQVLVGHTTMSYAEVDRVVDRLKAQFPANSYHVLTRNCNVFSDTLCMALLNRHIPSWINRMANLGKWCTCCLPAAMQPNAEQQGAISLDEVRQQPSFKAFQGQGNRLTSTSSSTAAASPSSSSSSATAAKPSDAAESAEERRRRIREATLARLKRKAAAVVSTGDEDGNEEETQGLLAPDDSNDGNSNNE
eukprot:TRINITY_DN86331_c0_g1_i1.p1 TRINITY_DN86331_c0_g1~~TRINITY_DN86331_c0_g1_i1.p1  ORF type:complete len:265 (-),score=103.00 TRINITY_DN86331_c0_g1_i1:28-822(-)